MAAPSSKSFATLSSYNVPHILDMIHADPTWFTLNQLVYDAHDIAQLHPTDVIEIANVLLAVRDMPDPPAIATNDSWGRPTTEKLRDLLSRCVYDMITTAFGNHDDLSIHPQNPFLIAALISAACARIKLCDSAAQAGMVACGLHFKGSNYQDYLSPSEYEVNAIHACLQLLVGGSVMLTTGQMVYYQDEVLPALVLMAEKEVINDPNGKKLLQVGSKFSRMIDLV